MPVAASPAGITFQAVLANSADHAGGGSKARTYTRGASRAAGKQDKAQEATTIKSDGESANMPFIPTEQKPAPVQNPVGGQESADISGNGSATVPAPDIQFRSASPDLSHQIAPQVEPVANEPATTTTQQPNAVDGSDAGEDKAASADATTVANALSTASLAGTGVVAQATGEPFKLQIEIPMAAVAANKASSVQAVGKAAQKNVGETTGAKNLDVTNGADAGKTKGRDLVGAVVGTSSHGAQSNGHAMQHSEPDGSQAAAVVQKVMDCSAQQAQAVPMHAAIHEVATTAGAPVGLQDAAHPGATSADAAADALSGDEPTATSGINAARLIQTMSETEMRVGMHSAEFGNISIRTSVTQQQMLAQISLDHGDLSRAISGHISSMQTKLGNDSGLQTLIQVNHEFASASGEQGSAQREQRAFASSVRGESAAVPAELDVGMSAGVQAGSSDGYRLDIRA